MTTFPPAIGIIPPQLPLRELLRPATTYTIKTTVGGQEVWRRVIGVQVPWRGLGELIEAERERLRRALVLYDIHLDATDAKSIFAALRQLARRLSKTEVVDGKRSRKRLRLRELLDWSVADVIHRSRHMDSRKLVPAARARSQSPSASDLRAAEHVAELPGAQMMCMVYRPTNLKLGFARDPQTTTVYTHANSKGECAYFITHGACHRDQIDKNHPAGLEYFDRLRNIRRAQDEIDRAVGYQPHAPAQPGHTYTQAFHAVAELVIADLLRTSKRRETLEPGMWMEVARLAGSEKLTEAVIAARAKIKDENPYLYRQLYRRLRRKFLSSDTTDAMDVLTTGRAQKFASADVDDKLQVVRSVRPITQRVEFVSAYDKADGSGSDDDCPKFQPFVAERDQEVLDDEREIKASDLDRSLFSCLDLHSAGCDCTECVAKAGKQTRAASTSPIVLLDVALAFANGATQNDVAARYNISQPSVSRIKSEIASLLNRRGFGARRAVESLG